MRRWPWLAAFVLATFFAFPQRLAGQLIDLGWLLSWLAPACLVLGLRDLAPRRAMRTAFLASLVAHTAVLHWLTVVTVIYGKASFALGLVTPVFIGAYVALFSAAFAWLWRFLASRGVHSVWLGACLWVVLDHLRSFALTGFPWATLGYAQHQNESLLGIASVGGIYLLSFAVVLTGLALASLWQTRARARSAWCALGVVALLHAAGFALQARTTSVNTEVLKMAALQGNIKQGVKWEPEWAQQTLEIYFELTRQAAAEGAELIVWPETAVPGSITTDPLLRQALADLAKETGAALIVGAVGVEFDGEQPLFFDSAFVLDAEGNYLDRYDKSHLVPFGEYVPLRDWFGQFYQAVARGIAPANVTAGLGPRPTLVAPAQGEAITVGVPICYELLFPNIVRRFVSDGAKFLVAITNDAWYGRTGAPDQFLAITAVRSVENRIWTLRAANTGISALIDSRGRVLDATDIFERGFLIGEIPLHSEEQVGSLYTAWGDVFALACWIALGGAVVWTARRKAV